MITLVLGGVRSGKSEVAERLATALGDDVTYLATGTATDGDMAGRIALHRARRPPTWRTLEVGVSLPAALAALAPVEGPVLVDSLGTWVAGCDDLAADVDGLLDALGGRLGPTVVVSEEVGLGVHPATALGRRFADELGALNRRVAEVADDVVLVVAGRSLRLGAP